LLHAKMFHPYDDFQAAWGISQAVLVTHVPKRAQRSMASLVQIAIQKHYHIYSAQPSLAKMTWAGLRFGFQLSYWLCSLRFANLSVFTTSGMRVR